MPASRYFFEYRLPAQPAASVPAILARPMSEIATAPRAEVVVIPVSSDRSLVDRVAELIA